MRCWDDRQLLLALDEVQHLAWVSTQSRRDPLSRSSSGWMSWIPRQCKTRLTGSVAMVSGRYQVHPQLQWHPDDTVKLLCSIRHRRARLLAIVFRRVLIVKGADI